MQSAILVFVVLLGAGIIWFLFWGLKGLLRHADSWSQTEEGPRLARFSGEEQVGPEGIVYLFSHQFVKPAPRRPLGAMPRDRAYACQEDTELCPDDFARQMLYAVAAELYEQGCLEYRIVSRSPGFMPPYPQKQWELQLRQAKDFPASPLAGSLGAGFDLCRKHRLRSMRDREELAPEEDYFSLEEILERALKAIRQEMSFWQRGMVCSDLRRHVEETLIAQGYLVQPDRETWLDKVRSARPTPNEAMVSRLRNESGALLGRLDAFKHRYGSEFATEPREDERGKVIDSDPRLESAHEDLDDLPLDDCLRMTIYETIMAIKQLEPSGEAGI